MSEKTYTSNLANGDPLDNNKQLVITRADMMTAFTDDEFQACTDAMSDGFSVVIHFASSGLTEAALTKISANGTLVFTTHTAIGQLLVYKVAPGATHSITSLAFDINDLITPVYNTGTKIADIRLDGVDTELYIPMTYVNESYTDPDEHIDYNGTLMSLTCNFDTDAVKFTGLVHIRFNKSNTNFTVTQYVDGNSNGIMSTASALSGTTTHFTMPVIIEQGKLKVRVGFNTSDAPSNVKFDLIGFNH